MRLFFHKYPLLVFVLFACVYVVGKNMFATVFQTDERQRAHVEIQQAIGTYADRQVALSEGDVQAAIRLFRTKSRRQPPSSRGSGEQLSSLGLITAAQSAQTSAQHDPDLFKQAGFASFERVPGVLASVSLGAFVLALEDTQRSLRASLRKGEQIAADPMTSKDLRAQITHQMGRIADQMKIADLMALSAKPLPGNLELIKRHRHAILQAMRAGSS